MKNFKKIYYLISILAKNGKLDAIKINQSSGDQEPVVRPDGQKPRVKSNILASQRNKQTSSDKKADKNGIFRHSKKVESAEFVFEPTTLRSLDLLTTTPPSPTAETAVATGELHQVSKADRSSHTSSADITTEVPVSSTPPTSLLDVFLSTQVLNTRAVDPTLASLHEKMKSEFKIQRHRVKRKKRKSVKKQLTAEEPNQSELPEKLKV